MILMLFSDRGTPDGYDETHGFSGTTFKFVKKTDESPTSTAFVYFKLHVKTKEFKVCAPLWSTMMWILPGKKTPNLQTLTSAEAIRLAGEDPDYGTRKLYKAIDSGNYPEYTVHIVRKLYLSFFDPSYLYLANNGPKLSGPFPRELRVLPAHRIWCYQNLAV